MPRKRAVNVCESCHDQKIRCDVDSTGTPCSKCIEIGERCTIRARKQYRGRKRARRSSNSNLDEGNDHVTTKIVAAAVLEPSSRIAPIFVGDGGYGAILDATVPTIDRHFHVPITAERALTPEDLEYLKIKGCFTLPVEIKELVEAYFHFVHPTFPVIDGSSFLQDYADGGHQAINLLLLWSMFSVSASYVPNLPRKMRKESYVQRAKMLFDLSQETDKTVLVQSALLLSFWFVDTEDVKQSWYWTSIAFSIAQTLGLYRSIGSTQTHVGAQQRSLWRNIWQCCMIRDVWLAFGMGRPLRINASDCDFVAPEDVDCGFADLTMHGKTLYSRSEAAGLLSRWQNLITTSNVLRETITSKTLSSTRFTALKGQINVQNVDGSTLLLTRVDRHLKLHQHATITALARASDVEDDLRKAADGITAIMQTFLHDNTTVYASPVTVPLVVPAMITYLKTIKDNFQEASDLANDKLNILSQFLTAIEDNYPAASILKRVLAAAREAATGEKSGQRNPGSAQADSMNHALSSWDSYWLANESPLWLSGIGSFTPSAIE
ncbi:fungal-specific transcription factor domain-containing protein [Lophiotrema nucula]|uniref:Fungal-specific transcription factor domain-containing protein n=1 Tax=Lophiotrema nucula TaxID=690887 RepID=A0A6A5YWC8_9PLEO|nr:fungal-specific transcription factor domain-containing protein [Lophiotrema nucula]